MCIWKDEKVNLCEQIWVWDYILTVLSCTQNSNYGAEETNRKVDERLLLFLVSRFDKRVLRGTVHEDFSYRYRCWN